MWAENVWGGHSCPPSILLSRLGTIFQKSIPAHRLTLTGLVILSEAKDPSAAGSAEKSRGVLPAAQIELS